MSFDYKYVIPPTGQVDNNVLREMLVDVKDYINGSLLATTGGTITGDLTVTGTTTFSGVVKLADGTVSTPALTFSASGNQDNGIYRIGTDNWGLSAGGTKCVDIKAAGVEILGANSNSATPTGFKGEIVEATAANVNYPTSGNFGDLASIQLTAGRWLITAISVSNGAGASTTQLHLGVSTTSGNSSAGLSDAINYSRGTGPVSGTSAAALVIPNMSVLINSTTTYYLKYSASYTVATPNASGRITAVRI